MWKRETGDVGEGSLSEAGAAGTAVKAIFSGLGRHRVDPDRAAAAAPCQAWSAAQRRSAGGSERHPLPGAYRLRPAHATQGLPTLADDLLVFPPSGLTPAVPHDPRSRPDADREITGRAVSPTAAVLG